TRLAWGHAKCACVSSLGGSRWDPLGAPPVAASLAAIDESFAFLGTARASLAQPRDHVLLLSSELLSRVEGGSPSGIVGAPVQVCAFAEEKLGGAPLAGV